MSKTLRFAIVIGIIVVAVTAVVFLGPRSGNVAALAAYKAELRAQGEKLTAEELGYPRPPESSTNLDLLVSSVNQIAASLVDGVHPGSLELMQFVSNGRAEVAWTVPQLPLRSRPGTSNTVTWEVYSAQFESDAEALDGIRAAAQNLPRYFFNDPTNFSIRQTGPFVELRKAAQWLSGDVMAALHAGQLARAWADIHALCQLAQFNREDLTLVSQKFRTAIAGLGLAVTWEALQAPGWSEEQLAATQLDWEAMDLVAAFEQGIAGERAVGVAIFAQMRAISPGEQVKFLTTGIVGGKVPLASTVKDYFEQFVVMPLWKANSEADEMLFLKHYQKTRETFRSMQSGTPAIEIDRQLKANEAELNAAFGQPLARYRYLVSSHVIPNFSRAASVCIRHETQRRLTITAIALKRFRQRSESFPTELGALVPHFLSAVPIDPMSAKPLRYQLNADGSFTLYSVGEDGRDDGGDPNPPAVTKRFGLWEGKDAVWPAAAK